MVHVARLRIAPLLLLTTLAAVTGAACVPQPANRATPTPGEAEATIAATPTPAGPTPTPSFVRPTPTPQPTFLVYTVHTGDSLEKIAKRFGTTGKSIAYWSRVAYPSLDPDSATYKPNFLGVGWQLLIIPNTEVDPENLPPAPGTPAPSEPPDTPAPST